MEVKVKLPGTKQHKKKNPNKHHHEELDLAFRFRRNFKSRF